MERTTRWNAFARTVVGMATSAAVSAALVACVPGAVRAAGRPEPHATFTGPGARAPQVLSDASIARLRAEGRSVLWVYFTDKGQPDARAFADAIRQAGGRLTARARARRARETGGRFVPDYYDLPVRAEYVDAVTRTGAETRHVSRWLNAMTVVADESAARRIANLSFVRIVTPALRSRRVKPVSVGPETTGESPRSEGLESTRFPEPLGVAVSLPKPTGYGQATTQLTGINAIAAHDSGWSAASITVGMFDSGFDKAHNATSQLVRVAERDFVFGDNETANQAGDVSGAWSHGTGTWSVLGGYWNSNLVGPAYNARFFLAKTEDIRSETPVEEDNWVAGAEWADSLGVDVISSSLAYLDFDGTANDYAYADLDGYTTVVARAAILAARRGIVVANSMANEGPGAGSLWSPADADSILSVGAVNSGNFIAGFSSRGPTADGRIKPEVVAQGVQTWWAVAGSPSLIGPVDGTSLACPLVGGAAALVREAHPEWTVFQVRDALMTTADKAATPNNDYGWGRIDVVKAIYGSAHGVPVAPKPFNLLVPAHNTTVTQVPVTFRWRRTTDPQGGALTYRLAITSVANDSCIFEAQTSDSFIVYMGYLGPSKVYEWTATAIDPQGHERVSKDAFRFTTSPTTGVPIPPAPPAAPQVVLMQNRPNPVRALTQIEYTLEGPSGVVPVTLRIFDASGRLVRTLVETPEPVPARCSIRWDGLDDRGRRASSGIYYYRLEVAGKPYARRLVLLR